MWLTVGLHNTNLHSSLSSPLLSSLLLSLLSFYLSLSIFFTIVQSLKGRLNVLFHLAAILVSMSTRYESPHPPKTWTQSLKHVTINIAINQFMYCSHITVCQSCSIWTAGLMMWRWIKVHEHLNKASHCKHFLVKELFKDSDSSEPIFTCCC